MTSNFLRKTGTALNRARRAFSKARKGNVAMIFAIAALPLLIATGAGIDLARALTVRGKLFTAVDAAALAVGSRVGITEAQAEVLAQQYFNANYNLASEFGAPNPIDVTITGQRVRVSSAIAMPTTLMRVGGFNEVDLAASSEVVWGQTKIWVGLALDVTGSMCAPGSSPCAVPTTNSKLYALKEGTKGMLTLFESIAAVPGDVRVSISPFAKDVNAGTANFNASWIDWTEWDAANGLCRVGGLPGNHLNRGQCVASRCTNNSRTTKSACTSAGATWSSSVGVWTPALHSTWNGCVADRGNTTGPSTPLAYDASNASPNATAQSKFPAEQWADCPAQMQPLSYNWTTLRAKVDSLVGRGNTNQPVGLAWAWQSLSPGLPLSAPTLPANTARHIIILSDGENTQNRWSTNRATIDTRMQAVCTAAKADDITIWSVFVDVGGAGSAVSMEQCATGGATGGKYCFAATPQQIIACFSQIAQQITNLRVAH